MAHNEITFQPGIILYDSVVGAFRARGQTFGNWCTLNNINPTLVRAALFGTNNGPKGLAVMKNVIDDANIDLVRSSYRYRMITDAERLSENPILVAA